ncbi:DUF438 domain-containing protein [Thermoanaerobacterium thermosaccharolyticum]|uniref:Uncharacterized protein n=1 Tax=Thermoanaerobacterium thermosaccharolyticum M0795 TaxID=698948 RepID=L0IQI0_THETR|nr:DUF438 domain-containing protein [Thermoanaerobacterium thermosaccharolyticum]AGB20247.1 hypothetical protein Thethe_02683 [Thermoanaerobacterium thermosaccharolyticum M0795]
MSELINNREHRQELLKEVIRELHRGRTVDEVKQKFKDVIDGITHTELSQIEQELMNEGLDVKEIQRLCDVHAAVFRESLEQVKKPETIPGHPVHTFKEENRAIEKHINENLRPALEDFKRNGTAESASELLKHINLLMDIDKHYARKENLLFPYLEKYGITGPPSVMWGVDDEIRELLKSIIKDLKEYNVNRKSDVIEEVNKAINKIIEMIFKEENILLPMALDTLTEDEWVNIMEESDEIGYCIVSPQIKWKPKRENVKGAEEQKLADETSNGYIKFDTGILKVGEISAIFDNLPFDITFVDKDDVVRYFSNSNDRIFARTKAVIGRKVQYCHPPASVHVVEELLRDFKSGKKSHEDFLIKMGDKYVYIRYFAVRDENGDYLGTLEVTQDIAPIKALEGEKRLMS